MFKDWKQFKKAWVKALRSGDYRQGQGTLVTYNEETCTDEFCCLGVAANLLIQKGHEGEWFERDDMWFFGKPRGGHDNAILCSVTSVPMWLRKRLTERGTEATLTNMNDTGRSFSEIADYIEGL